MSFWGAALPAHFCLSLPLFSLLCFLYFWGCLWGWGVCGYSWERLCSCCTWSLRLSPYGNHSPVSCSFLFFTIFSPNAAPLLPVPLKTEGLEVRRFVSFLVVRVATRLEIYKGRDSQSIDGQKVSPFSRLQETLPYSLLDHVPPPSSIGIHSPPSSIQHSIFRLV